MQKRRLREAGEVLTLGRTDYKLESVEGCGGSSVVYRASYEDKLNQGCFHRVLIKELFPYHPKGLIYREPSGNVCCKEEALPYMERCRQNFYLGNKANLTLLDQMPEQVSGNLNSYEAYGTYYSVLSVHGGRTLEALLEEGKNYKDLKNAAKCLIQMLEALKCFHQNGMLHLDISPDNLLMLPDRAMLIDYNSVWPMTRREGETYSFSEKAGYTAPEIRLREAGAIGPAADLYSVCAVFFRILTGRTLTDEEVVGSGLKKCFPKDLEMFRGQPVTAAQKAVQILFKGLHVLARKRYQTIDELLADAEELIRRIDGKGISRSAVWEGSFREFKRVKKPAEPYLKRKVRMDANTMDPEGTELKEEECFDLLRSGRELLLKGPGGMGKTRFLMNLWEQGMKTYQASQTAAVYVPLADYQAMGEEPCYIRRYILRHLCFFDQVDGMDEALHELDRIFEQPLKGQASFVLLLDGLNEAGSRTHGLLKEVEELGKKQGIGVLVTDRTDSVKQYGLYTFSTAELLGLDQEVVKEALKHQSIPCPPAEFLELLCNPMMLSLYEKTMVMGREDGRISRETFGTGSVDDMAGAYLESLCVRQLRLDSGSQEQQLRHSYLIRHLLPDIAGEMKRKGKILLTFEELYGVVRKNYFSLQKKSFAMAFPEYLGKSRIMLKEIADEREWFDYAVEEQLTGVLNLLEKSGGGNYRLIHDNFMGYLESRSRLNSRAAARYKRKEWMRKGVAGAALAALLLALGTAVVRSRMPAAMSEEDRQVLKSSLERLILNVQVLDLQIGSQQFVLEQASKDAVLKEDPKAVERLGSLIEKRLQDSKRNSMLANDGGKWVEALSELETGISLDVIQSLYARPGEMEQFMEEAMDHLEEGLCSEESIYRGEEDRERLITVYQDYLDAYAEVCYLELNQILSFVDQEEADRMLDSVGEMDVFRPYLLKYPLSGQPQEERSRQMEAAKKQLKLAKDEMKMQSYKISAPDW